MHNKRYCEQNLALWLFEVMLQHLSPWRNIKAWFSYAADLPGA